MGRGGSVEMERGRERVYSMYDKSTHTHPHTPSSHSLRLHWDEERLERRVWHHGGVLVHACDATRVVLRALRWWQAARVAVAKAHDDSSRRGH